MYKSNLLVELLEGRLLLTRLADFVPLSDSDGLAFQTSVDATFPTEANSVEFESAIDAGHEIAARLTGIGVEGSIFAPDGSIVATIADGSPARFPTNLSGDYKFEVRRLSNEAGEFRLHALMDAVFASQANGEELDTVFQPLIGNTEVATVLLAEEGQSNLVR
ncbi:MAG: hypothetical protein KDB27_17820 [Planctomycetales bacterium]|nr:hypothetical protein [Planctomycetales bacterium]